jgi:hypothetical protein
MVGAGRGIEVRFYCLEYGQKVGYIGNFRSGEAASSTGGGVLDWSETVRC